MSDLGQTALQCPPDSAEVHDDDAKWDARHQLYEAVSIALTDHGRRGAAIVGQILAEIAQRLWV
jgi:hypothetical protein